MRIERQTKNWSKNAAKVQKSVWFRKALRLFDDYKTCLFDGKTICREQMLFENKKHEVYAVNKHKIALNRDDDKRIVQADGITALVRGYVTLSA